MCAEFESGETKSMAKKSIPSSLSSQVAWYAEQLTLFVSAEVERRVIASLKAGTVPSIRAIRLCPVPGCGKPGAGPRNRFFCHDHKGLPPAKKDQVLQANRERTGVVQSEVEAPRVVRVPTRHPRTRGPLDMSCRVEGCGNRSRGPRVGFICDTHLTQLTPDEQVQARASWKARKAMAAKVVSQPVLEPVRPIVRKPPSSASR